MRDPLGVIVFFVFAALLFGVLGYHIIQIRRENLEKEWRQDDES